MKKDLVLIFGLVILNFYGWTQKNSLIMDNSKYETATFGAGCFWCVEAIYQSLNGVDSVISGYSGGYVENPSYKAVCNGTTGHAEVTQISYAPNVISFKELLEVFWQVHDPTTLNQQGNDFGTQYRSVIYYHNDEQKRQAEFYMSQLDQADAFKNPIVTEITKFDAFYVAEEYHQNYFQNNAEQSYCQFVVKPKYEKFKKAFSTKLKNH